MSAAGRDRAEQFSWPRVTAKVDEYYGFVIRRLAATGQLPEDFRAPMPQAPPRPGQALGVSRRALGGQPHRPASSLQAQAE